MVEPPASQSTHASAPTTATTANHRVPFTPEQLVLLAFVPGDADARRTLYEMGQADARAWAREQGWPGA